MTPEERQTKISAFESQYEHLLDSIVNESIAENGAQELAFKCAHHINRQYTSATSPGQSMKSKADLVREYEQSVLDRVLERVSDGVLPNSPITYGLVCGFGINSVLGRRVCEPHTLYWVEDDGSFRKADSSETA